MIRLTHVTQCMAIAMAALLPALAAAPAMADQLQSSQPSQPSITVEQTQQAQHVSLVYEANLGKLIRKNLRFNTTLGATGNPDAVCLVKLTPEGEVDSIKIVRSSGMYGFDTALQLAIYRSAPFPRRDDGIMPKTFTIHFWLR